jgi:hypothetical protein
LAGILFFTKGRWQATWLLMAQERLILLLNKVQFVGLITDYRVRNHVSWQHGQGEGGLDCQQGDQQLLRLCHSALYPNVS